MKPRIFISTVSSELRSARQLTATVLQRLGYDPVWEEIFGTEPGDLMQVLRGLIDECEGLIQIVGRGYGAEPHAADPEFGRVSYTQYEFLYARRQGKKTWVMFAGDACTRDLPLEQLDLPRDPEHPDAAGYQAERRALQEAWRERLRQDGHLRHGAANDTELELKLERLKNELAELRQGLRRWQTLVLGLVVAVALLVGCVLLVQWRLKSTTEKGIEQLHDQVVKVQEGQTVTTARIRVHLLEASERARDAELAAAEKERRFDERERLRELAVKAHESRLRRIDDLAGSFTELEQRADSSPVLREMTRILNEEKINPVDQAIAYAERQRPALLERVRARKQAEQERNRTELTPLLQAAKLEQTRGRPAAARAQFAEVLELEPAWPQALESYAYFLFDQSVQSEYHGTLRAALADARLSFDLAERLLAQDKTKPDSQRVLSVASDQLGDLLAQRGQPGDAEEALRHYTRSLELADALLKENPESAEAARDVSVSLNKLGDFLTQRGQPGDAEQALRHYTRSLELADGLLKQNPESAQAARDVSISLEKLGDFRAQRGQPGDAEQALRHYTRSLEIREGLLKRNPESAKAARDVSVSLNKLGDFLAERGQPGDARQALRHYTRGRDILEELLKRNPESAQAARDVSVYLNKLGDFLAERGQPGDPEQALRHYTRDLEISEALLNQNPESAQAARDVSVSLNKLGDFLTRRGQPGDAEQALRHYTRGLELADVLLKQNPESAQTARDVSVSLEKLGDFLVHRGQPGDAERALRDYTRSLEILEGLLKRNPESARAARDVSVSLNGLGDFLAQRGQPGDAEQALRDYTRSLEIREGLRERNPDSAQAARDVIASQRRLGELDATCQKFESAIVRFEAGIAVLNGMIAKRLSEGAAAREKGILEGRLNFCQSAVLATGDWKALIKADSKRLPALLSLRATELAKQGRLADVAQAGAKLRELEPKTSNNLYNAACAYSLCAALVAKDKAVPTNAEQAERKKWVDLSLACLKEAIAAGYKNFDHMKRDGDLAPLNGLAEFQNLFPKPTGK
jgi:tetratricopeptide (TPR) repeat protein